MTPSIATLPTHWKLEDWESARRTNPTRVAKAARHAMAVHVRAMLEYHRSGVPTFDYGNNIRQMALDEGVKVRSRFPVSCRPTCAADLRGVGPFRWVRYLLR